MYKYILSAAAMLGVSAAEYSNGYRIKTYPPKFLGRVKPKGSPAAQQRAAKKRKALRARSAKK